MYRWGPNAPCEGVIIRGKDMHAASLLQSLHWLPVKHRITYKTAVLTRKVVTTSTPSYLSEMIHTTTAARSLRLAAAQQLSVPRTRTELSQRHLAQTRYRLMLDCIALYRDSSLKRSGMARVNKRSQSFTCHAHVYQQVK